MSRQQLLAAPGALPATGPRAGLHACLGALAVELVGAHLGLGHGPRLGLALGLAAALGGRGILVQALQPGRLRLGPTGGLALACFLSALLPLALLQWGPGPSSDWVRALTPKHPLSLPLILGMVVSGPAIEELLHRGLIQRGLARHWGAGTAGLVSATGFTLAHEWAGAGAGPQHFLAGLLLAAAADRSKGWWVPALLHAAGNAGWLLAAAAA